MCLSMCMSLSEKKWKGGGRGEKGGTHVSNVCLQKCVNVGFGECPCVNVWEGGHGQEV